MPWLNPATYRTCPLPPLPILKPIKNDLTRVKSRLYEIYKKSSLPFPVSTKKRWKI